MAADKDPHESYVRLQRALAAVLAERPGGTTAVGNALNGSPQMAGNWTTRGVSRDGALQLQMDYGISATYVLFNKGPMLIGSQSQPERPSDETLEEALEILYQMGVARPDDRRFDRLTWQSILAAAKAVQRGAGDRKKIVSELLAELGK